MALNNLRDFIKAIDRIGELVRVTHPVRARLEIAEIADRAMKSPGGGPALLFEHVLLEDGQRSSQPVAINLFGSMRRMCLALGTEKLDDIGGRISEMLNLKVPEGLFGKLAMLPKLAEIGKFPPRVKGGRPPCQELVKRDAAVNLDEIPFLTTWPGDGGRYITLPMVITTDPIRGIRNVGMYRVQVTGRNTLAMHWQRHKVGAAHWREMAARGERMPVVIALGGDPASIYSGSAPLPPTIDEFLFAGFLRGEPVELAKAITSELDVPAEAELVLEGYIDPSEELVLEGPFGDHTGFYSLADYYPQVHVTAVTSRRDPIYPATLVGRPPMEDFYLGHATERIFLPLLKLTIPEIVDYHMPAPGIFHNLVFVAIDKQYPGQAYKVMNALWGQGLMSLAKVLVVVDKGVNVQDPDEAWWIALNNIDPERDVRFTKGPIDVLDHSSRAFTFGSKMGIDATRKWKEEGFDREWPELITMDAETKRRVDEMWDKLGIRLGERGNEGTGERGKEGRKAVVNTFPSFNRSRVPPVPVPPREAQTYAGQSLLVRYVNLVKLPHTLFALPFALLGVLAASHEAAVTPRTVALVVVAFSAARWAAMGFNRIADRGFDARNPRTLNRELPRGSLSLSQAWVSVVVAAGLFVLAAALLNPLCLWLSPVALAWILLYSVSKRFTWWPHLWLGVSLAIAPVGGYLAVTGHWSNPAWMLLAITLGVATWVAGFDIFYALPDAGFDRAEGLRSAVVRLGESRAILLAKLLHGITIPALAAFGYAAGFGLWYYLGLIVAAGILVYEHQLVRPGDLSRLDAAFFTMNGVMSVTVFGFALVDRMVM